VKRKEDYEEHIRECRKLLPKCKTDEERKSVVTMIEAWETMAQTRDKYIERKERIQKLLEIT
jgi:hypothetical protein